jgi:hypothetical protein
MKNIARGLALLLIQFLFINSVSSAPACKGPNKNDPGCAVAEAAPAAISINSATVDWLNEEILIKGENYSGSTTVTIAGVPATINTQTSTQLDVKFPSLPKGNHNLVVSDTTSSSSASLSFYAKGELVNPDLTGCPCATDWYNSLNPLGLYTQTADCYELSPGGAGNPEDIAGTILTNPTDPSAYPQYPIGAAFTDDPNESVCQLTEVDQISGIPTPTDLVKIRINRAQQGSCHDILVANICNTVTPVP